jgi:hypothetical protein
MDETCCFAYNHLGTIPIETFLYHDDYSMFNEDAGGGHLIDDMLYYQVFEC